MSHFLIWTISLLAIACVITRPFRLPEATWAIGGAILLFVTGQIPFVKVVAGVTKGTDVYLFLAGMMLLSETAREEKLFDWLAAKAVKLSKGSAQRLFLMIYISGVAVTALLSNDATAVVLTPAVIAATRAAGIKNQLPYLLICAFIANAASFILPISNPANLVIYTAHLPSLFNWLKAFLLPSVVAIAATYFTLRFTQRSALKEQFNAATATVDMSKTGQLALYSILATVVVLLICSALNLPLGLPTFITGMLSTLIISGVARKPVYIMFREVSWSVLLLVAGLFVIVEALSETGVTHIMASALSDAAGNHPHKVALSVGGGIAFICNLMNNLPAGLMAGQVSQSLPLPEVIRKAILIGIDLGPNLSVTGSLATILWLVALRREGIEVSSWRFLKIGVWVMTIPLIFTLLVILI
jgi:arsenical pump membrane protein